MFFEFTPLSPVFLQIGVLKFHYYGLMYVLAFSFAYLLLPYIFRIRSLDIKAKEFENIFFFTTLGGIIGGRLFYALFYNLQYFLETPLKIFAVWEGGMASHGGFLGAGIALYFLCRFYKLSYLKLLDAFVVPAGIGLMLGRLGNLINGELYGRITEVSWCMNFDNVEGCRHPSQVYAMIKDFSLFALLFSLRKSQWIPGTLAFIFLSSYFILRFIVEFFREPDAQIGFLWLHLSEGQWISLGLLVLLLLIFIPYFFKEYKRKGVKFLCYGEINK